MAQIMEKCIEMETSESSSDTRTIEESIGTLEEEEVAFIDINVLLEHNVSSNDVEQLKLSGINTIKGVQMCTTRKLLSLKGFNESKVAKIKEACSKILQYSSSDCFVTALELCDQRKQIYKLKTGSEKLDKILGGGLESMAINEVFGESRTGKTQLAHTLCVTAQIPTEDGYTGGKVIYIDTEHTFRPDRILPIADRFELDSTQVLQNIIYTRPHNSEEQYNILNGVTKKLHEEPGIYKLLIVDSIIAQLRFDFTGFGEMSERQTKLGLILSKLKKISEEYNIVVFLTNQITSDVNYSLLNDLEVKPLGGNILAHSSTTRIALKKGKGNVRIAKLYDSPNLEETEAEFVITRGGISDPKNLD